MALKRLALAAVDEAIKPCSPLLRGDGPETGGHQCRRGSYLPLAVPSYGAMALKQYPMPRQFVHVPLAVPSYGAMALKPVRPGLSDRHAQLAVPSYGAMALKLANNTSSVTMKVACSPLLRGDGPETRGWPDARRTRHNLQSPPTGRWP